MKTIGRKGILKKTLFIIITSMAAVLLLYLPAAKAERLEATYYGMDDAQSVLENIDYTDIADSWARDSIVQSGAFDIIKGYGEKRFEPKRHLSKEEAIAVILRMGGREEDAQRLGEALEAARNNDEKLESARPIWSAGYLRLAADGGLISPMDFADAMNPSQSFLEDDGFIRTAPARRDEFAYWTALVIGLQPVYGQQKIFNSFLDWEYTDPIKIPYVEAVLKNNIMNGNANGYLNPGGPITREQAAQIICNAKKQVLPLLGMEEKRGVIENVLLENVMTSGYEETVKTFLIRSYDGALLAIKTQVPVMQAANEQSGESLRPDNELVVLRNGITGKSNLLKIGDRVEFFIKNNAPDGRVRFVKVLPNIEDTRYIAARISSIDSDNKVVKVKQFFELDHPDLISGKSLQYNILEKLPDTSYAYLENLKVDNGKSIGSIESIGEGSFVVLTLNNDIITRARISAFPLYADTGIVRGIVEDNNPSMGYITLYNEDGKKPLPGSPDSLLMYRTFSYANNVEVFRDHKKTGAEMLQTGDSVYLKLDSDGNVVSASGVPNYNVKGGVILSVAPTFLAVEFGDGTQGILNIDENTVIEANGMIAKQDELLEGDHAIFTIYEGVKGYEAKKISVSNDNKLVTSVYRGTVQKAEQFSNRLIIYDLEKLQGGRWINTTQKGLNEIKLDKNNKLYVEGIESSIGDTVDLAGRTVYIAVRKDYGDTEKAVVVSMPFKGSKELLYTDNILSNLPATGNVSLLTNDLELGYNKGTIIVNEGRLVTGRGLAPGHEVTVIAGRNYKTGEIQAGVISVSEGSGIKDLELFRGRISSIVENSSFTLESFSKLKKTSWDYANTPKTFDISASTRMLDENGVMGIRNFKDYGENNMIDRTVYVAGKGTEASLISTAPYAAHFSMGTVWEKKEGELFVRDVRSYESSSHTWKKGDDISVGIPVNGIIIKNGSTIAFEDIGIGDELIIIRKDIQDNKASIIIIE